jgi:hypothetical protein
MIVDWVGYLKLEANEAEVVVRGSITGLSTTSICSDGRRETRRSVGVKYAAKYGTISC